MGLPHHCASWSFSPVISGGHRQIHEGRAVASRQHKDRRVTVGSGRLVDGRNPPWAITQADYAATSQLTSGQPYSAAKVVKDTLLPIPKNSQTFSYNSPAKLLDLHLPTTAQLLCMWRLLKPPHIPFNSHYDYILLTALSTFSWLAEAKLCSQLPHGHYLLESSRMVRVGEDRNFPRFPKMSVCGQMLITSQGQMCITLEAERRKIALHFSEKPRKF